MTRRQITVTVISVIACTWKRSLCGYFALMQYYRFLLSFQQHELQLWVCNLLSPKGVDMFRLYTFLWLCTQILMVLRGKTLCNPTWAMWLDPNFRSFFFFKKNWRWRTGRQTLSILAVGCRHVARTCKKKTAAWRDSSYVSTKKQM